MASTTPLRRPWTAVLQRWPTALALGMATLTLDDVRSDAGVASLAGLILLLPLEYLIIAKLRRRQATWPVAAVAVGAALALQALDGLAPAAVLAAVALIVLVWGVVDGQLFRPGAFRVQALGTFGFGALALVGLIADPDLGRWLVAAGWFLHGVWDLVYFRLDRVVVRSYAEWCGVFDLLIAAELVFLS
jgi:hypothetical protein